jgi:DsbC/DsbD-like thiol-disulfide interchange protein
MIDVSLCLTLRPTIRRRTRKNPSLLRQNRVFDVRADESAKGGERGRGQSKWNKPSYGRHDPAKLPARSADAAANGFAPGYNPISMKTLILTLLLSSIASANDLVTTQMMADVAAVAPGKAFTVGVRFKIAPEYHIYWINPGDTGIPTKLTFTLPPGFTAGDVQFPVPRKFVMPGNITAYGYEDEVMLLTTITPRADLKEGQDVTIGVKEAWLVCDKDQCVPGQAKDELKLHVGGANAQAANTEEFEKWRAMIPSESDNVQRDIQVGAPGGVFKSATGKLIIDWKESAENVEWFPAPPDQLMVTSSDVKTENGKSIVTFKIDALPGEKVTNPSIFSVIGYTVNGQRRGVAVPVSLTSGSQGK